MDHDVGVGVPLDVEQPLGVVVAFLAGQLGMDFRHPALVAPFEKAIGLQEGPHAASVIGILLDHQHEWMDGPHLVLAGIGLQGDLDVLVVVNAVLQLDPLKGLFVEVLRIEVGAGADRRLLDEAIGHRLGQVVAVDHIAEGHRPGAHGLRCRGDFEAEDRLQLVDRIVASGTTVAVRLVHQQDEIRQAGQVLEVALADVFLQAFDARRIAPTHLRIDLRDVKDVDDRRLAAEQVGAANAPAFLGVFRVDDQRWLMREGLDAFEDVLGAARPEVFEQLLVNGQVGGQHEEVAALAGHEQVADERAHEPRLAHSSRDREADAREVPFEAFDRRIHRSDRIQRAGDVGVLRRVDQVEDLGQQLKRLGLRFAQ